MKKPPDMRSRGYVVEGHRLSTAWLRAVQGQAGTTETILGALTMTLRGSLPPSRS